MPSRFMRSIFALVLAQAVFGTVAQSQAQQAPDTATCGGMEQKDIEPFRGDGRGQISVLLCDGSIYVGIISEMKPDSFSLNTGKNKLVHINYATVTAISLGRPFLTPSRSEKAASIIEHFLTLPFIILQCLLESCGS
jgi:hypothetical protein